jgi:sec-independent protein translocase protein TatA
MNLIQIQHAGWIGTPEIVIIVLVIVLLFGGRKIPELMRGIGKGVKEFKEGINEGEESANKDASDKK